MGIAEPIYHMAAPPVGMEPNSWESAKFAMETMVLHWSIHPYALYTLPVIAFAFAFFNMKKPFSVTSQLSVITDKLHIKTGEKNLFPQILDTVLLFAMGLGILGVICTGTLNMGGSFKGNHRNSEQSDSLVNYLSCCYYLLYHIFNFGYSQRY